MIDLTESPTKPEVNKRARSEDDDQSSDSPVLLPKSQKNPRKSYDLSKEHTGGSVEQDPHKGVVADQIVGALTRRRSKESLESSHLPLGGPRTPVSTRMDSDDDMNSVASSNAFEMDDEDLNSDISLGDGMYLISLYRRAEADVEAA